MKRSTKNKAEGKFHQAKGKMKEKAGKLTNNPRWEKEGKAEIVSGQIQHMIGKVEDVFNA